MLLCFFAKKIYIKDSTFPVFFSREDAIMPYISEIGRRKEEKKVVLRSTTQTQSRWMYGKEKTKKGTSCKGVRAKNSNWPTYIFFSRESIAVSKKSQGSVAVVVVVICRVARIGAYKKIVRRKRTPKKSLSWVNEWTTSLGLQVSGWKNSFSKMFPS